ncbi:hypothetical protein G3N95_05070 [Paraburkholderia sp. Tr-20389]|uniref:hypothetical protein n=1 Tax=Paraburkholderia sp. Tr-20389 TaxID=2703903 RepID=UPI0019803CC0|nr:hypothetical protein [Paraburkholderia sp. Tr-20389]MBN3752299.1 hypothetical protein [Paraburkholderia sp. Tr-20389]
MTLPDLNAIASVLLKAVVHRRLVTYRKMHALFNKDVPLTARYELRVNAVLLLSDCRQLDYGAVLMLDSGLPGDDFVARFERPTIDHTSAMESAPQSSRGRTAVEHAVWSPSAIL